MKYANVIFLMITLLILAVPALAQAETLTLPANLQVIKEDAFCNTQSLDCVVIPEGVTRIEARAFANSSVFEIVLPESLEFIAENAFSGCRNIGATVVKNSYAHKWCKDHSIPYQVDGEVPEVNPDDYFVEIKFSNVFQPTEWNYKASRKFADMVNERTDGHIAITYYGQNQLDCYGDSVTNAANGRLWIGLEDPSILADYVGDCAALIGPMLYHSDDEYNHVMDSDLVDDIKARLAEENLHILDTHYSFGFRSVYTNRVITKPTDLKGVKLRATASPLFAKTIECLGATAVSMSFTEALPSISAGVIEGFEGSISTLRGAGAPYELVKKAAMTRHLIASRWMFMPEDLYQSIPKKWRDILDECAVECGIWEQQMVAQDEANMIAELKAYGVTFNDVDLDAFMDASAPVHEWIAEEYGADPTLSGKIMQMVRDYRRNNP